MGNIRHLVQLAQGPDLPKASQVVRIVRRMILSAEFLRCPDLSANKDRPGLRYWDLLRLPEREVICTLSRVSLVSY